MQVGYSGKQIVIFIVCFIIYLCSWEKGPGLGEEHPKTAAPSESRKAVPQ